VGILRRSANEPRDRPSIDAATKVLVLGDNADACELLMRVLGSGGYAVGTVRTEAELLSVLVNDAPSLVVLDVTRMNHGDALAHLEAVRSSANPRIASQKVLLCASAAGSTLFAWEAGVDEVLQRPFHARVLLTSVSAAIRRPDGDRLAYRRAGRDRLLANT
jgi:DNA-binding response OmpR family regulator